MLQTCTRCRHRRIKCDSRLPACANCAKSDLECTFRDEALQEDVPRSYVQTLNERIKHLRSQLALCRPQNSQAGQFGTQLPPLSEELSFRIIIPTKPGSDLHLDNSIPSLFARVVFEALPYIDYLRRVEDSFLDSDQPSLPAISCSERSQLTPAALRFLLSRYDQCIRPQYDVAIPEVFNLDESSFKKLPDSTKFQLLMACAIAAAREAYRSPIWKPLSQICRNWANELIMPILTAGDSQTVAAILFLLIYELADPTRGITWELLDLAARTCLQLGWHQASFSSHLAPGGGSSGDQVSTCSANDIRLLSVLKEIEGSLQTIFSRPNMLCGSKLPATSENETIYDLYTQISNHIYGRGRLYETQGCPFVGELASLMEILDTLESQHQVVLQAWLCFLPVCFRHRQCLFCLQEADEEDARGMRTLRRKIVTAAVDLMGKVHSRATTPNDFTSPIMASSRAFIAGCSLATAVSKKWTTLQAHTKELIYCTEVLSMFAPHWKGGNDYLSVWRIIVNLLFSAGA